MRSRRPARKMISGLWPKIGKQIDPKIRARKKIGKQIGPERGFSPDLLFLGLFFPYFHSGIYFGTYLFSYNCHSGTYFGTYLFSYVGPRRPETFFPAGRLDSSPKPSLVGLLSRKTLWPLVLQAPWRWHRGANWGNPWKCSGKRSRGGLWALGRSGCSAGDAPEGAQGNQGCSGSASEGAQCGGNQQEEHLKSTPP